MTRYLFLFSFILAYSTFSLCAQTENNQENLPLFAVINDNDGYTNIRDENKKIIGKIFDNEIFVVSDINDPIGDYLPITWQIGTIHERNGYIHKSRAKLLYKFALLKKTILNNSAIFENDSIKVKIDIGILDLSDEKIILNTEKYPEKIKGCKVWGADCISLDNPDRNTEIKSIEYTIKGVTHKFKLKDIAGYLFPSLQNTFVSITDNGTIYISMNNGDGAGSYSLLWVLQKDKIIKKIEYIAF